MWNRFKREGAPWWVGVSKCCAQEALRDLRRAFKSFFASRQGRRKGPKVGLPGYRKRGRDDRFRLTGAIRGGRHGVQLLRIGWVRSNEPTTKLRGPYSRARYGARRTGGTSPWRSRSSGPSLGHVPAVSSASTPPSKRSRWCRTAPSSRREGRLDARSPRSGVGARRTAERSGARTGDASRPCAWPGSTGGWPTGGGMFTTSSRRCPLKAKSVVVIEDLMVKGMVRSRSLAHAISDAGWGEFRRLLEYNGAWSGTARASFKHAGRRAAATRLLGSRRAAARWQHRRRARLWPRLGQGRSSRPIVARPGERQARLAGRRHDRRPTRHPRPGGDAVLGSVLAALALPWRAWRRLCCLPGACASACAPR